MARSGDSIETRIGLRGGDEIKSQLEQLGRTGEAALRQLGTAIGDPSNAFGRLSAGAEEVRRHLVEVAAAGQTTGNSIRAALLGATQGVNNFSAGTTALGASSGQLRFALQNLSFQVNDVATSLASGSDPMRVFAQQGGQIFQVFQQGGGARAVFGAAATAIGSMITPLTLAAAGAVALAAGFALIAARAAGAQASARQFDVILKGLGKSSQATGKELEEAARKLRDVGLNVDEARTALSQALREGIKPQEAQRIIRIGADLNAVLGEGSMEKFISAAAKGGEPLREFAERLGLVPKAGTEAVQTLRELGDAAKKSTDAINDALKKRGLSIFDEQRRAAQEIADLTRKRGTERQEIELASSRRIVEINRDTNRAIFDILDQRNKENAQKLAEFNKQIGDAAQKAADKDSLVKQIKNQVEGSADAILSPWARAMRDLGVAWDKLLDAMANSAVFQGAVTALQQIAIALGGLFKIAAQHPEFTAAAVAIGGAAVGLTVGIAGLRLAFSGLGLALAPVAGLLATFLPVALLAGIVAIAAAFVDWKKVLDGTTWSQFKDTLGALWDLMKAVAAWLVREWVDANKTAFDLAKSAFDIWWQGTINGLNTLIGWYKALADVIKSVFGAGGTDFGGGGDIPGNARGGFIRGAGTGTSDSIPSWLSDGEFVATARAVRYWGVGVFDALNRLQNPFQGFSMGGLVDAINTPMVPRGRGFAAGGFVGAGAGGGVPVHLHLDGQSFALRAEENVVEALTKHARSRKMLSAGKKPSWYG